MPARVVLPGAYVPEHLALSYAVTVHKAQGLTVERSIVVLDDQCSAELAYVTMTRGRRENRACLVTEVDEQGHEQRRIPPTPAEALAEVLGRSGAERSATEVLWAELAHSEDLAVLVPALIEARRFIDACAGPDRREEVDQRRAEVMDGHRALEVAAHRLREAQRVLERARAAVDAGQAAFEALDDRGGLFRRRSHGQALGQAQARLGASRAWVASADQQVAQAGLGLRGAERRRSWLPSTSPRSWPRSLVESAGWPNTQPR